MNSTAESTTQKKKPIGIGGWLGFYLWANILAIPAAMYMHLGTFLYPQVFSPAIIFGYKKLPLYYSLFLLVDMIVALILYCCMVSLKVWTVKLLKYLYMIEIVFYVSIFLLCVTYIIGNQPPILEIYKPIRATIGSVIWLIYFNKSKRVKNTFRSAETR